MNAREIAQAVARGVERWGAKNYGTGEFHLHQILDAVVELDRQLTEMGTVEQWEEAQEELKRLRKELSLAKAREGKRRKAFGRAYD